MDAIMPGERYRRPRVPAADFRPSAGRSSRRRQWLDSQRATLVALIAYAAFLATGQFENARAQYAAALGTASRTGHRHGQARAHNGLGRSYQPTQDEGRTQGLRKRTEDSRLVRAAPGVLEARWL